MRRIELRNVSKSYGGCAVLQGVSLGFATEERIALRGPSGEGKTTLVRLMLGLERPDAGEIDCPEGTRFAVQFQEDRLAPALSAAENVALVLPKEQWPQVLPALARVGIGPGEAAKRPGELSGGQKRRVALVRAVLAPGHFLLLDEPFKGLDDAAKRTAEDFVLEHLGERGLLLVTHDKGEAKALCQREFIL